MRDRYASLREGLVGAWIPSVSGSGLLLPDLSGQGNNGTLTNMGPEDWVSSQYGRALDFDGVNDYVNIGNLTKPSLPATISAFVTLQSIGSFYHVIANDIGVATINYAGFDMQIRNTGQISIGYGDGLGANPANRRQKTSVSSLTLEKQVHLCGVIRDAVDMDIYIDARNDGGAYSGTGGSMAYTTANGCIGAAKEGLERNIPGQLDDVRIYNRALSEPEIKLLSQEPGVGFKRTRSVFDFGRKPAYLPPTPTDYRTVRVKQTEHTSLREGLVGAWCPSIEGSGYTLPDLSGQGNNGTLTNMGPEDWVSSQYGRALDFDGSNDYVTAPDTGLPTGNVTVSLSHWLYLKATSPAGGVFGYGKATVALGAIKTYVNLRGTGVLSVEFSGQNPAVGPALPTNTWHHIAVVKTPGAINTTTQIYLNGILQSIGVGSSTSTPTIALTAATFGVFLLAAGDYAPILLDDCRIYNRALSESEIKLLASRPGIGLRPQRRTMYYAPPNIKRNNLLIGNLF